MDPEVKVVEGSDTSGASEVVTAEAFALPMSSPEAPSTVSSHGSQGKGKDVGGAAAEVGEAKMGPLLSPRSQVSIVLPEWTIKLGYNFNVRSLREYHEVINFVLYGRIALFLTLLISWACAASANSIASSALRWGLAFGILAWLWVSFHGVVAFLSLGEKFRSQVAVQKVVAYAIYADVPLLFLSVSAFTSLADTASALSSANTFGFLSGLAGRTGASASFMFFSFLIWVWLCPLLWIVCKDRLIMERGSSAAGSTSHPPVMVMNTAPPGPTVANV